MLSVKGRGIFGCATYRVHISMDISGRYKLGEYLVTFRQELIPSGALALMAHDPASKPHRSCMLSNVHIRLPIESIIAYSNIRFRVPLPRYGIQLE